VLHHSGDVRTVWSNVKASRLFGKGKATVAGVPAKVVNEIAEDLRVQTNLAVSGLDSHVVKDAPSSPVSTATGRPTGWTSRSRRT